MNKIENQVESLLTEMDLMRTPVPVRKVAEKLDLVIRYYDLGPGVSGALFLEPDNAVIGVNPDDPKQRKRFTIAHEIGHYCLHKTSTALFVDKGVLLKGEETVLFRDSESSLGEKKKEKEANSFAAALLMPVTLLINEIKSLDNEDFMSDESVVKELARRFDVSQVAMTYRLINLGLLQ